MHGGKLCNCAALRAAPFTAILSEPLQQKAALGRFTHLTNSMQDPNTFPWTNVWSAIAALAAAISALLSVIYTRWTLNMVREQSDPRVIVYVSHDNSRPSILQIVVKNIGSGAASDIIFKFSKPLPGRAFGLSVASAEPAETITEGPLVHGIPFLAPGESREITWGQFGGLYQAMGDDYITVTSLYTVEGRALQTTTRLEVRSFNRTNATESEAAQAVKEIKRLATAADAIKRSVETIARNTAKRADEDAI